MKFNVKLFLIDWLVAMTIIIIGLTISKTLICGMFCGIIYWFITDLIGLYFKEREENKDGYTRAIKRNNR